MTRFFFRLLCVVSCTVGLCAYAQSEEQEIRIVQTPQGPVKGYKDLVDDVYTFFGIPYATAPTGADRYKAPLPGPSWLTLFDANNDKIMCPQADVSENMYEPFKDISKNNIRENCLIANVYVPNTAERNLPVMVVVHGGAFQIGSASRVSPKKLVRSNNIIVVSFNYRLGIHGFLCLGTEYAPGNAGMKDQVALLQWVNKNIASFGGNPKDVTLLGYSAGGASVELLMLSPLAKGMFNKVIAESGSSLGAWAVQTNPIENAKVFAGKHNLTDINDIYALEEFYKSAPFETITSDSFFDVKDSSFYFTPCIESDVGQEIFLADSPFNIMKSGKYVKVPLLYGITDREGLFRIDTFDTWKYDMNKNFSDFLPHDLQFKNIEEKEKIANEVKEFYFGDKEVNEETILSYVDFFSDSIFTYPILKASELHVKAGHKNVYFYEYNYVDELTPVIPHTDLKGANHCAVSFTLCDWGTIEDMLPDELKKHKAVLRELWGNFIKTGAPVPEGSSLPAWPPMGSNASPHMSLGRTLELRGPLLQDRMSLWDAIYSRHYRSPRAPSLFTNNLR